MKKLLIIPIVLATTLIPTTEAKAENVALRICEYVQANDKGRLRSFLKQNKLKLRNIYKSIQCNNDTLLVFSAKSQALEVGEYVIGKLPSKVVKAEIDEIAKHSAHMAEEARER